MSRLVQPELLDTLPPDDPGAVGSRRDLRRLNTLMGHQAILIRAFQTHLHHVPKQITELGAGDGNFLFRLAQKTSPLWPDVKATLLDRQQSVPAETLAAFGQLGWRAEAVVVDVFDWSPEVNAAQVVIANLFLHHFEDARLAELLRKIAQHAEWFVAIEPHRFALPKLTGSLFRLMGCNRVTCHDAPASIRAGFAGREISALWPDQQNWQLTERRAGLFSHLFSAQRRE